MVQLDLESVRRWPNGSRAHVSFIPLLDGAPHLSGR